MPNGNIIADIIKIFAVVGFIIATIGNLCIISQSEFGFSNFLVQESVISISCLILLGFLLYSNYLQQFTHQLFCHIVGLGYVSCSPFFVPIARLVAAQAVLNLAH